MVGYPFSISKNSNQPEHLCYLVKAFDVFMQCMDADYSKTTLINRLVCVSLFANMFSNFLHDAAQMPHGNVAFTILARNHKLQYDIFHTEHDLQ